MKATESAGDLIEFSRDANQLAQGGLAGFVDLGREL
jgi:hypothetical protein